MEAQAIYSTLNRKIQGFSLIIAPLLFTSSTFFWNNGEYSVTSASLIIFSIFFWIPAFAGLFSLLKNQMPQYAIWGFWIAVYGAISGIGFAYVGYLTTVLNISHTQYIHALAEHSVSSQVLLFAAGPIFPLSILLLGINLLRTKTIVAWISILLCLAAIAFPLSRIPRIEMIAHIADIFLLVPCAYLGFGFLSKKYECDFT